MSKLRRSYEESECYHITTAVGDRATLLCDARHAAEVIDAIQFIRGEQAHVLAYVVMPDHVHIVLAPKEGCNISRVMQSVKGYTSRTINALHKQHGPFWQRSFYDRILRDEEDLFNTIDYVHMNPVVAGLVDHPEAFPFSSAGREEMTDLAAFIGT